MLPIVSFFQKSSYFSDTVYFGYRIMRNLQGVYSD